jgi:hypothetical protein
MALLLERMLYEKAPNLETYCDLASLEDRIHEVTEEKYRQALFKAATSTTTSITTKPKQQQQQQQQQQGTRSREDVLKEVLKGPRYEMAKKLIKEIKIHKLRRGTTINCTVGSPRPRGREYCYSSRRPTTTTTMMDGEQQQQDQEAALSARQSLPHAVYTLFFHTPLVIIFEKYPVQRLKEQNWNALLEQAIHNLRAYNKSTAGTP